jgi:hypothetical protein
MQPAGETVRGELWGVVAYFNPTGCRWSLGNLEHFSRGARRQGLRLLVVELAFGDAPFEVSSGISDLVIRSRSETVLWQKERLLNVGLKNLPPSCDKVAWLDGDLIFENADWVDETSRLLESSVIVQPFDTACWLPHGADSLSFNLPVGIGEGHCLPGIASVLAEQADHRRALADYRLHGHTGFAWAGRRAFLDRHGLYDRCILGGGDVVMAHCFYGDEDFFRGRNFYCRGLTKPELVAINTWGRAVHADVRGRIGYAPGRVLHLYHGDTSRRDYIERLAILREAGYDPSSDVALDDGGTWRWNSDKPDLHRRARDYFLKRNQPTQCSESPELADL